MSIDAPALHDVRVLELGTGHAAPYAARLLGDIGATVVKVENADGDPTRLEGPAVTFEDGYSHSALFEFLNLGKKGLTVDPTDRARLDELLRDVDIVILGDDPSVFAMWNLDAAELQSRFPDLVIVAVTPYGTTGPKSRWQATDLTLQAASGLMSFSGVSEREPLRRGLRQSTYECALTAAYAAQVGLLVSRSGAGGTFVDLSMVECISSELVLTVPEYTFAAALSARRPSVRDPLSTGEPVRMGDGYVTIQLNTVIPMDALATFLGEAKLADPRFGTAEGRSVLAHEVEALIADALVSDEPLEFFTRASEQGLLTGLVQDAGQVLSSPQTREREVLRIMPGTLNGREWAMPLNLSPSVARRQADVSPAPRRESAAVSSADAATVGSRS